eukprot:7553502-Karenia_brevis.AAC.1
MVTGIILTLIRDGYVFGLPFVMPVGDILTAFDLMRHNDISDALRIKGVSAAGIRLEMRELADVHMSIQIPSDPPSGFVPLQKAGIQGGVRTPDQFNASARCTNLSNFGKKEAGA